MNDITRVSESHLSSMADGQAGGFEIPRKHLRQSLFLLFFVNLAALAHLSRVQPISVPWLIGVIVSCLGLGILIVD